MAITKQQFEELGFKPGIMRHLNGTDSHILMFSLGHEVYFWVSGDKLYCKTSEMTEGQEFIYLEFLTLKALKLYMERTVQRFKKHQQNQEHLRTLNGTKRD